MVKSMDSSQACIDPALPRPLRAPMFPPGVQGQRERLGRLWRGLGPGEPQGSVRNAHHAAVLACYRLCFLCCRPGQPGEAVSPTPGCCWFWPWSDLSLTSPG